jgi:hypothetical protein
MFLIGLGALLLLTAGISTDRPSCLPIFLDATQSN